MVHGARVGGIELIVLWLARRTRQLGNRVERYVELLGGIDGRLLVRAQRKVTSATGDTAD